MIPPSDTPPDGDFARYVERLTSGNISTGSTDVRPDMFKPEQGEQAGAPFSASSGMPSVKVALEPFAGISFLTHVKWVFVAWMATQLLARLLPGAGFLFIPFLLAYAAWVVFRVNAPSVGALAKRFKDLADAAARNGAGTVAREGARGAAEISSHTQQTERKHKP